MNLSISLAASLISEFRGLRTFPVSAAQIIANGEKWEESRKGGMILQIQRNSSNRRKEWHHVMPSSGRREREARTCLFHMLSRGVQRIQPIITFIFSPNFVGLETQAMQQSETPFCFSNFERKQ